MEFPIFVVSLWYVKILSQEMTVEHLIISFHVSGHQKADLYDSCLSPFYKDKSLQQSCSSILRCAEKSATCLI